MEAPKKEQQVKADTKGDQIMFYQDGFAGHMPFGFMGFGMLLFLLLILLIGFGLGFMMGRRR